MRLPTFLRSKQTHPFRFTLALGETQIWTHDAAACGLFVACLEGSVWLTDGEGADRVLDAGDRWGTTRSGRIVVEALARARLEVEVALQAAGRT